MATLASAAVRPFAPRQHTAYCLSRRPHAAGCLSVQAVHVCQEAVGGGSGYDKRLLLPCGVAPAWMRQLGGPATVSRTAVEALSWAWTRPVSSPLSSLCMGMR